MGKPVYGHAKSIFFAFFVIFKRKIDSKAKNHEEIHGKTRVRQELPLLPQALADQTLKNRPTRFRAAS